MHALTHHHQPKARTKTIIVLLIGLAFILAMTMVFAPKAKASFVFAAPNTLELISRPA